MSAAVAYMNPYGLPWSLTPDVRRFQRILGACVAIVMLLAFVIPLLTVPPPPAFEAKPVESTMRIIVEEDAKAQQQFMHPNYMLNGPAGAVKRKAELVAMLARGDIASERFSRVVEGIAITGNVGIVMGSEVVTPAANSNLGRMHPGETLNRRYTNVFLWEGGRWRFLARQASIVAP